MTPRFAIAWCFEDQSPHTRKPSFRLSSKGASVIVPAIWKLEVGNGLVVAERRKKISPEKSARFIQNIGQFSIEVDFDGINKAFGDVINHARMLQRSAYDASYLELAGRLGAPLATKDAPMRSAAVALGIAIFQP